MKVALKIIFFMIFFTFQLAYASDGFIRFSIEKSIYQNLSDSQKENLTQKIQELNSFVTIKILEKIPKDISEKLSDLKIKVFFDKTSGRDGLFTPTSTGEQIITLQITDLNSNGIKALLAHEIYHAIHYHLNADELPWIREGMAQLFEYITTGELNGKNLYAAILNPMTPLLGDYNLEEVNAAQYGHDMLYFYYLYNHCGEKNIFWKITDAKNYQEKKGSYLIDAILSEMNLSANECQDFSSSAIAFEVAKLHNQIQFLNATEKNKYLVAPVEITPTFSAPKSAKELEKSIKEMPVLSALKISQNDFQKFKGTCQNCEIFYALKDFPYTVSEKAPSKSNEVSVILVKTLKN